MKRNTQAFQMAFGGVMAALAVVIMCLGTMIPFATFACPMICMVMMQLVVGLCGQRTGWAWYGAVAILALLLGPDKEAAAVFVFLGYYPILKPKFERRKFPVLWKLVFFNVAVGVMYFILLRLLGLDQVVQDYEEMGVVMTVVTLLLGNVTFILLDVILSRRFRRR